MIKVPKVFLVSRKHVNDPRVQRALQQVPVAGVIVAGPDDAVAAADVSNAILMLRDAPLAIVADFDIPLTVISDDSTVETLIDNEQTV